MHDLRVDLDRNSHYFFKKWSTLFLIFHIIQPKNMVRLNSIYSIYTDFNSNYENFDYFGFNYSVRFGLLTPNFCIDFCDEHLLRDKYFGNWGYLLGMEWVLFSYFY